MGCCTTQHSVADYFDRGFYSQRLPTLGIVGKRIEINGLWAEFSLEIKHLNIAKLRFKASACTTLVAYCQLLCEHVDGSSQQVIHDWNSQRLIDCLSGVPIYKQDRAPLAITALHSAIARSIDKP